MGDPVNEIKIADLVGVREYSEGDPVELWINTEGRVVVRAFNECLCNRTDVDLFDLLDWLRSGNRDPLEVANELRTIAVGPVACRDQSSGHERHAIPGHRDDGSSS